MVMMEQDVVWVRPVVKERRESDRFVIAAVI